MRGFGVGGGGFLLGCAERHLELVATHGFGVLGILAGWVFVGVGLGVRCVKGLVFNDK